MSVLFGRKEPAGSQARAGSEAPEGGETPAVQVEAPRSLVPAIRDLFPRYVLDGGGNRADASRAAPRLRIVRDGDGWLLSGCVGGPGRERHRDRIELLCRVELAVTRALLREGAHRTHLHAGGAVLPDGAVLVFGPANAGKSSVTLAWSVAGHPVLGDDLLLVDGDGRARPFHRLMKVDRTRLRAHGIDPRRTPHFAEEYRQAWFDPESAGGWWDGPVRPVLLAFLRRERGPGPRMETVQPADALNALLGAVLPTGRPAGESLDALHAMLDRAPAVRISYRSSDRIASVLAERVSSAGTTRAPSSPDRADRRADPPALRASSGCPASSSSAERGTGDMSGENLSGAEGPVSGTGGR